MKFNFTEFILDYLLDLYKSDRVKIVVILDENEYLLEYFGKIKDTIQIYSDINPFSFKLIENSNEFLDLIKDFNSASQNLILFTSDKNVFSELSELRRTDDTVDFSDKILYYQNILGFSCGKIYSDKFWNIKLRLFRHYLVKICDFLLDNISHYQRIFREGVPSQIKHEFLLYIFFKDILEIYKEDSDIAKMKKKINYIIEKIFQHSKVLAKLSKSSAQPLYQIFKNYLSDIFSNEIYKFIIYFIEKGKTDDFINLCISLKIFLDLEVNPMFNGFKDFAAEISPFIDNIDFNAKDENGGNIFSDLLFDEITQILNDFFKYELNSDRIINIKPLLARFEKANIILNIEKKFDFFRKRLRVDNKRIQEVFRLTKINFLYSGIVSFNKILFHNLFEISGNKLIRRTKTINILAQYVYFIDNFKGNIYYKIKLREYILHYKFLKNIIKLFLLLRELDNIDGVSIEGYQLEDWKKLYINYLLPIDTLLWSSFENTRLFWSNIKQSDYMLLLSENIVRKIKEINLIFLEFLRKNYKNWVANKNTGAPISVVNVIKKFFNLNDANYRRNHVDYFLFIIIDCCRTDIWDHLRHLILKDFPVLGSKSIVGLSILPTGTKFARRALVTGKYPSEHDTFIHSNEGLDIFEFLKHNYFDIIPEISRLSGSKSEIAQFYTVNCELLDNNNIAIENISNNLSFQFCVFNFPDTISHNFEISMNEKILETIYEDKIKPIIRKVLELKSNPVIFFGTDHGIVKCRDMIKWGGSSFQKHWMNNEKYIHKKNRYFVSKDTLKDYTGNNILKIENDLKKWGLKSEYKEPWTEDFIDIKGYYFGMAYDDLLGIHGERTKKYAHGGSSFFELFIPFAIISKQLLNNEIPKEPLVELSIHNNSIRITNPNNKSLKILNLDFYIHHYHYIFQNLEIKPKKTIDLELNMVRQDFLEFDFKTIYVFNERNYTYKSQY